MLKISFSDLRKEYKLKILDEKSALQNPIEQFSLWFQEALDSNILEPNAMTLSTIGLEGFPSSRVVLLKGIENGGFNFFTNYHSKKGKEMEVNPNVCLNFVWLELERQVNISGTVRKLSLLESTQYFHSRPRESQIGAWVSEQSIRIESRKILEDKLIEITEKYNNVESIPKPNHWGGYCVTPQRIEFWQGRPNRLHDRLEYTFRNENWIINRLAP